MTEQVFQFLSSVFLHGLLHKGFLKQNSIVSGRNVLVQILDFCLRLYYNKYDLCTHVNILFVMIEILNTRSLEHVHLPKVLSGHLKIPCICPINMGILFFINFA